MNSAPTSTISPAALKNARISHSTAWTGLREVITPTPDTSTINANR